MGRIERRSAIIQRVDHDHRRSDRLRARQSPTQRVSQQHRTQPLALPITRNCKPTDQRGADQRIAGDMFSRRIGNVAGRQRRGAKRVVAKHAVRVRLVGQDKHSVGAAAHILPGLGMQIAVKTLNPAGETGAIMAVPERSDGKVRLGLCHRSCADAAAVLRKRAGQPLARLGRMGHRLEKRRPVAFGQVERLMFGDGAPRGV
jgi:hypothetical protein